jgi:hypothetical protein
VSTSEPRKFDARPSEKPLFLESLPSFEIVKIFDHHLFGVFNKAKRQQRSEATYKKTSER